MQDIISNFQTIVVENPVDKIIKQLKQLIATGQLKPGEKLPAERKLAEKLGVGRSYVREAISKLEFYGLLKTSPQSGTYVSGYNIKILEGLLTDVINLNTDDFSALIEARYYLEVTVAGLAAARRTEEDLGDLKKALGEYEEKVTRGVSAVEEDMFFHFRIAHASGNTVFESIMLILLPDIIRQITEKQICGKDRVKRAVEEHKKLMEAIEAGSQADAERAMAEHLDEIMQISRKGLAGSLA
jgi:GntR family transcriptional repressor for pyruvate dehydrogenase complex